MSGRAMVRRLMCSRAVVVAALLLAGASRAFAQPLVDPQRAEFTPSPDHSVMSGGTPLLDSYRLEVYVTGQTTIFATANLGKPAPEADGKIRVAFLPLLSAPLVPGVVYEARVKAIGPGGTASSTLSNTFTLSTCAP